MDKEYLIIYSRSDSFLFNYHFPKNENELLANIDWCQRNGHEIMFAAKIAVTKEFIR